MEETLNTKQTAKLGIGGVLQRTFHFMDWVDGNHVDEMVNTINRETVIKQMKVKYPNHNFSYVCELY